MEQGAVNEKRFMKNEIQKDVLTKFEAGSLGSIATAYAAIRRSKGTQAAVAKRLGVDRTTIARREIGMRRITSEAWAALKGLK